MVSVDIKHHVYLLLPALWTRGVKVADSQSSGAGTPTNWPQLSVSHLDTGPPSLVEACIAGCVNERERAVRGGWGGGEGWGERGKRKTGGRGVEGGNPKGQQGKRRVLIENTTSDRKPSSAKTALESISRTGIGVGHGMLAAPTTRAEGAVGWDLLLHQSVCV